MNEHFRPRNPRMTVAVVSRNRVYLETLRSSLTRYGVLVRAFVPGHDERRSSLDGVEVLVLDTGSFVGSDLGWVSALHRDWPLVEVLAIAGDSPVSEAVRALREGAFTVLQHPVADALLVEALDAAGRRHRHARARLAALNGKPVGSEGKESV